MEYAGGTDGRGRFFHEVLVVYPDEATAARVMNDQREAVRRCPTHIGADGRSTRTVGESVAVGDEAIRVSQVSAERDGRPLSAGTRSRIVRRGVAVLLYSDLRSHWGQTPSPADFAQMEQDAHVMQSPDKMCIYDPDC